MVLWFFGFMEQKSRDIDLLFSSTFIIGQVYTWAWTRSDEPCKPDHEQPLCKVIAYSILSDEHGTGCSPRVWDVYSTRVRVKHQRKLLFFWFFFVHSRFTQFDLPSFRFVSGVLSLSFVCYFMQTFFFFVLQIAQCLCWEHL